MSKTRIGVIGAGRIAQRHIAHLKRRNDAVVLTAIADLKAEAAAAVAANYGFESSTTDYRQFLRDVDAILVCVPNFLHHEVGAAALAAGKHVFCEKPMTRTVEQANVLLEAAAKSNAQLQVGFVRRFDEEWLAWRDAVLAAKIGRPVIWRDIQATPGPPARWFNQDELGGGPFVDSCIHNLDFALYTFGPAEWVFCHGHTLGQGNTAVDTGTATIRFKSGDELLLAWSWGLPAGTQGGRILEILGGGGTIVWPAEFAPGEERYFTISTGTDVEKSTFPSNCLMRAFDAQMDEFISVTHGEVKPRASGVEGLESQKLAVAILDSARRGEVVRVG